MSYIGVCYLELPGEMEEAKYTLHSCDFAFSFRYVRRCLEVMHVYVHVIIHVDF